MRIISGEKRGLKLYSLEGEQTRPTLDRVKESLFNILDSKGINYEYVLDLFSGSGALGIETLSRGAQKVVFCDKSKLAIDVIKKNLDKAKYLDKSDILNEDYITSLQKLNQIDKKFDIVFLDPPYNMGMGINAIELISQYTMLKDDGIIVLETNDEEYIPNKIGIYEIVDIRKYGKVRIYLFN